MGRYKKYMGRIFLTLIIVPCLFSCTTARKTNYLQDRGPNYSIHPYEDYHLQRNDEVSIAVLTTQKQFADLFNGVMEKANADGKMETTTSRSSFIIYENGEISIPFFGDIKLVGLTIPEAEAVIQKKMTESVPDVQVKLSLNNKFFTVYSTSAATGRKRIYKDNMTIYQALAIAGDVNETIDLSKVKIVRTGSDGRDEVETFDLRTSSVIESQFYYIKPNDFIYYTTSSRTFWRISSFTSFITTVLTPITFLIAMKSLNF